jgi:hypothetical protein
MPNPLRRRWFNVEFFALPGLRLGRKYKWAESLCSLPSRMAAWRGAQVGLHRSPILRPGIYTIARLDPRFQTGNSQANRKITSGLFRRGKRDFLSRVFVDISPRA